MTIDEIKTISLVDFLSHHSCKCTRSYRKRYWYLSPLHEEKEASFKVDLDCNMWYDFAEGKGGNIINLAQRLYPNLTPHEILRMLEQEAQNYSYSYIKDLSAVPQSDGNWQPREKLQDQENGTAVSSVTGLNHYNLLNYVSSRGVDVQIAKKYCQQVNYNVNGKNYYAIAFYNTEKGMEARNKYCKRCIGVKTYSAILMDPPRHAQRCCVFEGFFDFLSYAMFKQLQNFGICIDAECDYIVLNSVSNLHKVIPYLNYYRYIHCYLDNDKAGKKATHTIVLNYPEKATDESFRYEHYKDLNDALTGKAIEPH